MLVKCSTNWDLNQKEDWHILHVRSSSSSLSSNAVFVGFLGAAAGATGRAWTGLEPPTFTKFDGSFLAAGLDLGATFVTPLPFPGPGPLTTTTFFLGLTVIFSEIIAISSSEESESRVISPPKVGFEPVLFPLPNFLGSGWVMWPAFEGSPLILVMETPGSFGANDLAGFGGGLGGFLMMSSLNSISFLASF